MCKKKHLISEFYRGREYLSEPCLVIYR